LAVCGGCSSLSPTRLGPDELTPGAPLSAVYANVSCENLGSFSSNQSEYKIPVIFKNTRNDPIQLYWINYSGEEEFKAILDSGEQLAQNTYISHPWVVRDSTQKCLAVYATRDNIMVDIKWVNLFIFAAASGGSDRPGHLRPVVCAKFIFNL